MNTDDKPPTEPIKLSGQVDHHHHLQLILGAMPTGVVVVDKNLVIQAFNPKAEAITGVAAQDAIGRSYDEVMQIERGTAVDPLKEALASGKTYINQRFYLRSNSETDQPAIPIRHSATVIADEKGKIVNGVTIFTDISRQVALERRLEGQRRYLRDILRSIPDGVVTTDAKLIIESWNEAAVKITGRPAAQTIGQSCDRVLGATIAAALENILNNGQGTTVDQTGELPLLSGRVIPVGFSADTLDSPEDERVQGGVVVFRDMRERLAHQQQLAWQKRYLGQVLDLAPYGIFTVDPKMVIQTFNKAAEALTGFAATFATGKPYHQVIKIDPESGLDPLSASIAMEGQNATVRLKLIDAGGKKLAVRYSTAPLTDVDGSVMGSIVVFDDIGDILAAERTKNEFFSMISHELRTPLTSIKGFVTAVLEERAGSINNQQRHFLSISRAQSDLLLTLINDLLDLSRLESGKIEINISRIDVESLMYRAADAVAPLARPKALNIEVQVDSHLPHLWADENKLFQVLQNLLSNAIKFTPVEGKIELRAALVNEALFVLSVSDSGIGIPPEEREHIFDPFYQVENIQTRQVGGTGLGLPIVKNIIEEHHSGKVELESEMGQGTTFYIYLPRTQQKIAAVWDQFDQPGAETTSSPAPAGYHQKRPRRLNPLILIVDDEPTVSSLIQFTLEEEGYDVIIAANGQEAMPLAIEQQPDLITLDVLMPEMDGFHVLGMLKRNPATANIPVCMVSIVEDKIKGYQMGAIEYVTKPFEREQLLAAVNAIIRPLPDGERQRVLIVEDDPNIIELVEVILADEECDVIVAHNGVAGLEKLRREHPTLVLLDIMIPKIDGYEFIRQAKADARTADIPIIVLSVRTLDEDIARALRLGAEKYLTKSANIKDDLSEIIQKIVRKALDDDEQSE